MWTTSSPDKVGSMHLRLSEPGITILPDILNLSDVEKQITEREMSLSIWLGIPIQYSFKINSPTVRTGIDRK